ncbi:MAG: SprT family zinc-dependent metalloprotease [Tatlockia sp.]
MLIQIENHRIVLTRKRIKNINLRLSAEGALRVSAPLNCPLPVIENFLNSKREWIGTRLGHSSPEKAALHYVNGEMHWFQGKKYRLLVQETNLTPGVRLEHDCLHCLVSPNASFEEKKKLVFGWYRTEMLEIVPALLTQWEETIGVKSRDWVIKDMKTRWGSCHLIKKRICLNLKLMQKPLDSLEYVLVHELVHLLEASHNHRFHALMSQFMPDWKQRKKGLMRV